MPDGDGCRDGDVEGVFCAYLGNFKRYITLVDNLLVNAVDLVSGDEGVAPARIGVEIFERNAAFDLFEGADGVALGVQAFDSFEGRRMIAPRDRVFGSESGFVDFGRRRAGCDAAQAYAFDGKGVAGSENGTDVIEAPHVVEDYDERNFFLPAVFLDRCAVEIPDCLFFHDKMLVING